MKAGLCDSCRHQKVIRNTRGSTFSMCERSKTDQRYPKYPRLPVVECAGWERLDAGPERSGHEAGSDVGPRRRPDPNDSR
jgi:hypothetical protein